MNVFSNLLPVARACVALMAGLGFSHSSMAEDEGGMGFPPVFFPGLVERAKEDVYLQGVVRLYPGRLLDKAPDSLQPVEPRMPLVEDLPGGIGYVRVYDLPSALPALKAGALRPAIIWDLRYVATPVDTEEVAGLSPDTFLLCKQGEAAHAHGNDEGAGWLSQAREGIGPVIVLVNQRTRGGVEAALASLQQAGAIMTVGTRTAGQTGAYQMFAGTPGYWIITNEILPSGGESLLGLGLKPAIAVEVTPEQDFLGYQLIESGQAPEALLRLELPTRQRPPRNRGESDAEATGNSQRPADPVLQRAVEIIVALRVLGQIPPP